MPTSKEKTRQIKKRRVNGTPIAIIIMIVMVISLMLFISVQERRTIINPTTMTQTAVQQQVLETGEPGIDFSEITMPPRPVVNVNGIVLMGGIMVIIVLIAFLREALR